MTFGAHNLVHFKPFLRARRAKRGLCYGNVSVRLSVRLSQPVLCQNILIFSTFW